MNAARLGLCLALALTGVTACDSAAAAAPQGPDHAPATRRVDADALPTFNTTPPIAEVSELEFALERAAEVIAPSVVSIVAVKSQPAGGPALGGLERFLLDRGARPRPEHKQRGLGSGVIVSADGYVLTNNHVVEGADSIEVQLHDDRTVPAELVGTDSHTDIAVIKIQAEGLQAASLGDSDALKVGRWVMAAGSPFGLSKSVSAGIVSAIGRADVGITDYEDFIQTDATINPGNSGGPLVDLHGRVVGINTAIATRSGGSNGIGFAVPINMARAVMEQLVRDGEVVRGWIGVMIGALTPELAESFSYDGQGVLVQDVVATGPAASTLHDGDIILELNGRPVKAVASFRNAIAQMPPRTAVKLKIWRNGQAKTVAVTLGELPATRGGAVTPPSKIGATLSELDDGLQRRYAIKAGGGAVVTGVDPGSLAERAGLREGDVIAQIDGVAVASAAEAGARLRAADLRKGVRLRIIRGDYGRFVVLRDQG